MPDVLPSTETGAAPLAVADLLFVPLASVLPNTDPSGPDDGVRVVETRAGKLTIRELAGGSREIRYPEDGRFDAVVESSGDDLVREGAELLRGRPVQMVYVPVGTNRELMLQYCVPGPEQPSVQQSGMVVWVSPAAKIRPPWIRTASLPPPQAPSSKSSVFYGTLEKTGKLHNLHAVTGAQYQPRPDLLAYFDEWLFRPAEQDGAAVEIEILLIVPAGVAL